MNVRTAAAVATVRLFAEGELAELIETRAIPSIQATSLRNAGRVVPDNVKAMYSNGTKTALFLSADGETVVSAATGEAASSEQSAEYLDWLNGQIDEQPEVKEPATRQVRQGTGRFSTERVSQERVARSDKRGQQTRKEKRSAGQSRKPVRRSAEPSHRIEDFDTARGEFSLLIVEDGESRFPARINPIQAEYLLDWMQSDEAGLIEALQTVADTGDHK